MIFKVIGRPQGKARARTFYDNRIGKMRSVTPESTKSYEELIRWSFLAQGGKYAGDMTTFKVDISARYEVPKSWSKKKRNQALSGIIKPKVKPDCDNVIKCVLDALNGVAYYDDTQVIFVSCEKKYAEEGSVLVHIEEIKDEP